MARHPAAQPATTFPLSRQRDLLAELASRPTLDLACTQPILAELEALTTTIDNAVQAACHELAVVSEGLEGLLALLDEADQQRLTARQLHTLVAPLKQQLDAAYAPVRQMI